MLIRCFSDLHVGSICRKVDDITLPSSIL